MSETPDANTPYDEPQNASCSSADSPPPTGTLPEREDAQALTVVGMGGSAGSISALQAFFENVPADTISAYVVVVHLSADYESHLPEVLARSSVLPVQQVTGPVRIEARHVYVIPPGKHLEIRDGELHLQEMEPTLGRRIAIDTFFRTLADAHGPQAAAVVFSGTGADGTLGIRQIKEWGGLVVAQSPSEADFDAMPRSAIATGMVDYVLPVTAMPAQIAAYWKTSRVMRIPAEAAPSPAQRAEGADQEIALHEILTHVRVQTGHDFAVYKRATVLRRIGRRMQVNGVESLLGYRDFLWQHPAEMSGLIGDLLISVTQFFRDPNAWATLERDVISPMFANKTGGESEIRAWVCGCATGEEAYTLAILLLEQADRLPSPPRVQVFATDMDAPAIAHARVGVYPDTIAVDVSEERLRRWFHRQDGTYQIRKEVREIVLFAHHDVLRDTPFSRLDLITCRNLLIYFNREAQERVFRTFHFALRPDTPLMLGPSESAEGPEGLFLATNKNYRLFIRRSVSRSALPLPAPLYLPDFSAAGISTGIATGSATAYPESLAASRLVTGFAERSLLASPPIFSSRAEAGSGNNLSQELLPRYGPPVVVVNEEYTIVHLSGSISDFLRLPDGAPTFNLLELVQPNLRPELRSALFGAVQDGTEQTRIVQSVAHGDGETAPSTPAIRLSVRPVPAPSTADVPGYFVVQLESLSEAVLAAFRPLFSDPSFNGLTEPEQAAASNVVPADAVKASTEVARRLEQENAALQRNLRVSSEQYDAVTEELKASNEEMQAVNEEMRSVVEELETGKEELQSVNEELSAVNFELKARVEELIASNSDLSNFLGATDIATLFLDRFLNIKRFTSATLPLFNLIPTDIGRPLTHITNRLVYPSLEEDAEAVLSRLIPVEREITSADGQRYFLSRLLPYRSLEDRIEGVVVSFVDISARKRAEETTRQSKERLQAAIDIETVGVIFVNNAFEITDCNEAFVQMSGWTRAEIREGRFRWEFFTPEEFVQPSQRALEELQTKGIATPYEKEYTRKDGSRFWALFACKRISENEIVEFVTDITEQKRAEVAVRESEERFRLLVEGARDYAMFLLNQDSSITFWSAGAERIFGWTAAEVLGQNAEMIFTPEDLASGEHLREIDTALSEGRAVDRRWHQRNDGSRFWADGLLMRLDDDSGVLRGFAKVTRDATAQKRGEEALESALEAVAAVNLGLEQRVQERVAELAEMSQMRQELLRQLVNAQEAERARISRDLHDDTGQQITALLMGLSSLKSLPTVAATPETQDLLSHLQMLAGDVAQKSHRLSFTLRPTALDDIGLIGALKNYTEEWSRWSGLIVDIESVGLEAGKLRLPPEIETTIYRVTQEALTNVLRHAVKKPDAPGATPRRGGRKRGSVGATRVTLSVQRERNSVLTVIEDDGRGFDVEAALNLPPGQRRLGLFGMQERARLAGGTLTIESRPGHGTTLFLRLPVGAGR